MPSRRWSRLAVVVALLAVVGGGAFVLLRDRPPGDAPSGGRPAPSASPSPAPTWSPLVPAAVPASLTEMTGPDAAGVAAATARALVSRAPVAVVAAPDDDAALRVAAWLAGRLQAPLLMVPSPAPPTTGASPAPGARATPAPAPSPSPTRPAPDPVLTTLSALNTEIVVTVGDVPDADTAGTVRRVTLPRLPAPGPGGGGTSSPGTDQQAARPGTMAAAPGMPSPTGSPAGSATPSPRPSAPPPPDLDTLGPVGRARVLATADTPPADADLAAVRDLLAQAAGAPRPPADGTSVLVRPDDPTVEPAGATVLAAGHRLVTMRGDDPRGDPHVAAGLADHPDAAVLLCGTTARWQGVDRQALPWELDVARAGQMLPGGGQLLFPAHRLVALYGVPGSGSLGVLGEQDAPAAADRAIQVASAYQPHSDVPVIPSFEIIATVASGAPGPRGDYSAQVPLDTLTRWVDVATERGLYVVLDIQPGRTDFLTQSKRLAPLLARPNVGLALDPEWRLGPNQVHLRQIGSVDVAEVNQVVDWLAQLTHDQRLPQKLLVVHQFKLSMIRGREALDTPPELAVLIQMDGQGNQPVKLASWRAITTLHPPTGVWWGWKNFYDEDHPTRSPADTMALTPAPFFVSYQ